MNNNTATV